MMKSHSFSVSHGIPNLVVYVAILRAVVCPMLFHALPSSDRPVHFPTRMFAHVCVWRTCGTRISHASSPIIAGLSGIRLNLASNMGRRCAPLPHYGPHYLSFHSMAHLLLHARICMLRIGICMSCYFVRPLAYPPALLSR